MRIVGGSLRGRRLHAPTGDATRPTSDRLRETLFDILAHRMGLPDETTRVLDLFAGTGALGLEALSRGATHATFVDDGRVAQRLLRENISKCRAQARCQVVTRSAVKLGPCPSDPATLVFLDPPYGRKLGESALAAARVLPTTVARSAPTSPAADLVQPPSVRRGAGSPVFLNSELTPQSQAPLAAREPGPHPPRRLLPRHLPEA